MSRSKSLTQNNEISKFLATIGLFLFLSIPQFNHICSFIAAATQKGYRGKIVDIADIWFQTKHRTAIGRFLTTNAWCEDYILRAIQKFVIKTIWTISLTTGLPIYVIIDDTISEKIKPSSKAKKSIEKCKYHQSHLKNKKVYGHQMVIMLIQCGKVKLPYLITLYEKKEHSKIQIAMDAISSLPQPPNKGYVLSDSWYSSKDVIKVSNNKGFEYIGGLKTNRVIYPPQFRLNRQVKEYAKTLTKDDVHLVTVGKSKYYVHRYEGKLNSISKPVVVILSWPKDALFREKALKSFVSTDTSLTAEDILKHYCCRWPIEVFIRQTKMLLGLDKYQVRESLAIKRFWILLVLSYIYIASQAKEQKYSFSEGLRVTRKRVNNQMVSWIYEQAAQGISLQEVTQKLKVA